MEQGTEQWLAARVGLITGSKVGPIMNYPDAFQTRLKLMVNEVRAAIGMPDITVDNPAMRWGREKEEVARTEMGIDLGIGFKEVGLLKHPKHHWIAASCDGVQYDGDTPIAICEIKCPYSQEFFNPHERPTYFAQVQLYMEVYDVGLCYFGVWTPNGLQITKIARDPAFWEELMPSLETFRSEFLEIMAGQPKSWLDTIEKDMSDHKEWNAVTELLSVIDDELDGLNKRRTELAEKLKDLSAGVNAYGSGYSVSHSVRRSVDYKSLIADNDVNVSQYERETPVTTVRKRKEG